MNRREIAIAALEARIGHHFDDRAAFERALTHASATSGASKIADNDRLEFLGDRVLGLIIAQALMARDDKATSGELSKRLHVLVSGRTCARAARAMELGPALRLQGAESARGGRANDRILGDACEALIAVLYLELGLERTAAIVLGLWSPFLDEAVSPAAANPKSELQEWTAAQGFPMPAYRVLSRTGPDHKPRFTVQVAVGDQRAATANGGSVQTAERAAALALLLQEGLGA
ncbi:MAG TPA: ribonuclease III [Caulobacteraceae bacterium]